MDKRVVVFVAVGIVGSALGGCECRRSGAPVAGTPIATVAAAPGTLAVTARFDGTAPAPKKIRGDGSATCGNSLVDESLVVGPGGKLANVVVRVLGAPAPAAPAEHARLLQRGCAYRPHVLALAAGQALDVVSADDTMHNIHVYRGDETLFNRAESPHAAFTREPGDLGGAGVLSFKCDIHPWMTGLVAIGDSPIAVTGSDGVATLAVPAGHWSVEAWQEKLGTRRADVDVVSGSAATLAFHFAP